MADGGTLFLDEIGEMPSHMQVKILRAIQERKVTRLGGTKGVPVDARIVAATNRDLESMVAAGTFREDLYYRVNVVRIHLPPLRDRPGDALTLARHFVETLAASIGRKGVSLSSGAMELLATYPFPGNVRELSNAVERALILGDGDELLARDFQLGSGSRSAATRDEAPFGALPEPGKDGSPFKVRSCYVSTDGKPYSLYELERLAILEALGRNSGKKESTAKELGITRRTLFNKLNEYGYRE